MRDGRILQVDEPQRLYQSLAGPLRGGVHRLTRDEPRRRGHRRGRGAVRPVSRSARSRSQAASGTTRVVLGIRPECFADSAFVPSSPATIEARVEVLEEVGADAYLFFEVDAPRITAETLEAGDEGTLLAGDTSLFAARVDPRTSAGVGDRVELTVYPTGFHFFDPVTGVAMTSPEPATTDAQASTVLAAGVE